MLILEVFMNVIVFQQMLVKIFEFLQNLIDFSCFSRNNSFINRGIYSQWRMCWTFF